MRKIQAHAVEVHTRFRSFAIRYSLFAIHLRPAFSLVELMIGIVILGLGLIGVASIFPVAWDRARGLAEYTQQRATGSSAATTLQSLARTSGPSSTGFPTTVDATSFFGDFVVDRSQSPPDPIVACLRLFANANTGLDKGGDAWVHALNLQNVQVLNRQFVDEDPWTLEYPGNPRPPGDEPDYSTDSFFNPQIEFYQRVHPPMESRANVDPTGIFSGADERWDADLDTRRFAVGVLHRFRTALNYQTVDVASTPENDILVTMNAALASTRSFDVYYVTLRRPNPTNRYARQAAGPTVTPDPCSLLNRQPVTPMPLPGASDVMFPVPWRVEVEFPTSLEIKANRTGIPTEIKAPPDAMSGSPEVRAMVAGMFPRGAQFVDELTGAIYRVVKHRRIGPEQDQAVLTLEREIFKEDLDLEANDPRCPTCIPVPFDQSRNPDDPEETIRTVWVYPPPAEARPGNDPFLIYTGTSPVVGIDIETLTLSPR